MTLEKEFDKGMLNIYYRARDEAGYTPTIFFRMLHEHGGLNTARRLINASTISDGYAALCQRNRLDLTVEAVIYDNPKWHKLFTEDEMKCIRERLIAFEYPNVLVAD